MNLITDVAVRTITYECMHAYERHVGRGHADANIQKTLGTGGCMDGSMTQASLTLGGPPHLQFSKRNSHHIVQSVKQAAFEYHCMTTLRAPFQNVVIRLIQKTSCIPWIPFLICVLHNVQPGMEFVHVVETQILQRLETLFKGVH